MARYKKKSQTVYTRGMRNLGSAIGPEKSAEAKAFRGFLGELESEREVTGLPSELGKKKKREKGF